MTLKCGFLFLLLLSLAGCQKNEPAKGSNNHKENKTKRVWNDFPKSGKRVNDFVQGSDYEILDTVFGDLNHDHFKDVVVTVRIKKNKNADRVLLVLLKKGTSYELVAKNETILGAEFRDDVTKIEDADTITIENHTLKIAVFCYGPCGNTFYEFSWRANHLLLDKYSTFDMGAGAQMMTEFDAVQKTTKVTVVNTMKDEMPEETETNAIIYKNSLEFSQIVSDSLSSAILKNTKLAM